ncbi:MAG: hypothetical protein K6V97_08355 [Actinomycetia bacterium]|nr:hypothetical protein [Actinomycetes bacterium]
MSALVAGAPDHPLWETSVDLGLLTAPDPAARLGPALAAIRAALARWAPLRLVVATGEVARARPELGSVLDEWREAVWLLSGEEEARVAWWGEQARHAEPVTVIDVGGGSTEVVAPDRSVSLPVGAARPPAGPLPPLWSATGRVVALGGTAAALARYAGQPRLSRAALARFAAAPPDVGSLVHALGVSELRATLLPDGAACLGAVLDGLGVETVEVSPRDLRHGLWLAAALGRGRLWSGP